MPCLPLKLGPSTRSLLPHGIDGVLACDFQVQAADLCLTQVLQGFGGSLWGLELDCTNAGVLRMQPHNLDLATGGVEEVLDGIVWQWTLEDSIDSLHPGFDAHGLFDLSLGFCLTLRVCKQHISHRLTYQAKSSYKIILNADSEALLRVSSH